jgi:alanine racemase
VDIGRSGGGLPRRCPGTVVGVTVRLTIRTAIWRANVARTASAIDGLIPVVKGNGYGFGRARLTEIAAELSDLVAVGNVHELDTVPEGLDAVVLTPALEPPEDAAAILTVGSDRHVAALAGSARRVVVKLASRMQRFGGTPELVATAQRAGLEVVAVAIHPALAGSDAERRDEVAAIVAGVDPTLPVWVSHLGPDAYRSLPATHRYRLRLGTSLWHGDKTALHLEADVLDVRAVRAGDRAGYRLGEVEHDGRLVMIGAGTANGVTPLPDGSSPFHFARRRLPLHEPPHMHVSMALVADDPVPVTGDHVDVQRPLHMTTVDEYRWI